MTRAADTAPGAVELKPCPFCGSCDVELDCYSRDAAGVCIEPAVNCNGCGGIFIFDFKLKEPWSDLAGSWNTRTHPSVATGEIVERLAARISEQCSAAIYTGFDFDDVADSDWEQLTVRFAEIAADEVLAAFEQQAATIAERDELLGSDDLVLAVARAMKPKLFDPHLTQESLDAPGMYIARDQVFWMARQAIEAVRTTLNRSKGS